MAACKECLHYEVCKGWAEPIYASLSVCEDFKDKTKYVEKTNQRKCTKEENGYSFYVSCTCGAELNVDIYYWNKFKLCPNCGAKMECEAE